MKDIGKKIVRHMAFAAMIVCLFGPPCAAQSKAKRREPPAAEQTPKPASRPSVDKVLEILWEVGEQASAWEAGTAARLQAQVADMAWEADPERAALLLHKAWEAAGKVEEESGERSEFRNTSKRGEARREVLLIARKRAPKLANQWLAEIAEEEKDTEDPQPRAIFDDRTARSRILLEMDMQVVKENPASAAQLARESLVDGNSFGFQNVLLAIQEKNAELAHQTFRAALERLRIAGVSDLDELMILYSYLYTPGVVRAPNRTDNRGHSPLAVNRETRRIEAAAKTNPALAAEFIELAAQLLLSHPLPTEADPQLAARELFSVIQTIYSQVEIVSPALAEGC